MKPASKQERGQVQNRDKRKDVSPLTVTQEEKDYDINIDDQTQKNMTNTTKTPDKQIRQNFSTKYSEAKTIPSFAATVTPSPQVGKKKGKSSKSTPISGKRDDTSSNKIDRATGLTLETLNNLHRLLPNSKKSVKSNYRVRNEQEQVIPTSPLRRAMNSQDIWESNKVIRTSTVIPSTEG